MPSVAILSKYVNESREIAEKVAFQLGYPLITMSDLIREVSKEKSLPEKELADALTDISLYHRFFRKQKMKLISLVELKLCDFMIDQSLVFCGYMGYPVVKEVSHILDVLALAHPESGRESTAKPRESNLLSDSKAVKWFKTIYQMDMENPNLYDLCVNLWHMDESEAADIIVNTLRQKRFTPNTYSRKVMEDIRLAYRIRAELVEKFPDIEIRVHDGTAFVFSKAFRRSRKKAAETKQAVMWMDGVDYVEIRKNRNGLSTA